MSKTWGTLLIVLSMCVGLSAQTTTVTGTIQDANNQAYTYGTWQVSFHPNGFPPETYNINGQSFTQLFKGTMDVNGVMSALTLTDNALITPAGSQWDFQVCADSSTPCNTVTLTITGASQDVSTAISSTLPALGVKLDPTPNVRPFGRAYADNEILFPMEGIVYYNVLDSCLHEYTHGGWVRICAGGGGGGGTFNCPQAVNGAVLAATSTTDYSCDPKFLTDFLGHVSAQSFQTLAPYNGEVQLTAQNAAQPSALPTGTVSWIANDTVTIPTRFVMPPEGCTDGQVLGQQSHDTDPTGTARSFINCINTGNILLQTNSVNNGSQSKLNLKQGSNVTIADDGTGGVTITSTASGGVEAQVNGVDNANCTAGVCPLINFVAGPNITITNTSAGNVQITASGSGLVAALDPSAPVVTNGGTPGATTDTYGIVMCEDQSCTKHSAISSTGTTTTANATLSTTNYNLLKTYADTLYGYRYAIVCRLSAGGTPSTTGIIAQGVGKQFKDTGQAGDGTNCTSVYAANNTGLDQHCVGAALPLGVDVIPGAPCGVDSPPTSPKAIDDEFSWGPPGSWVPGDVNDPQYQQLNWGTTIATLTSGHLVLTPQNTGGNDFRMLGITGSMPATTWEFELKAMVHMRGPASGSVQSGLCIYDGTKALMFGIDSRYTQGMVVYNLTNLGTFGSTALTAPGSATNTVISNYPNWLYLKIKDDGANFTYSWSLDGVDFTTLGTTAVAAFIGAPTSIGPCQLTSNAGSSMSIDFFRETL